jgi:hypothetical protein
MSGHTNPEAIVEGFSEKLRTQWAQHRRQSFNTNTKGKAYEEALRGFLDEYFEGIYDIETRVAVIDAPLNCFDVLTSGENEIDVVATFRQAVPRIILESGDMLWVPWDAVAFICEVKSSLTKGALEDDLEKLAKLNELGPETPNRRFPQHSGRTKLTTGEEPNKETIARDASVEHQLKCLVYDEYNTSYESLFEIVHEFTDIWDLILIVDEDVLLISPELPFAEGWQSRYTYDFGDGDVVDIGERLPDVVALPDGLVWFVLLISMSIPRPVPFDTSSSLMQLVQKEWTDEESRYDGVVTAWHELIE